MATRSPTTPAPAPAIGVRGSSFVKKSLQDINWCDDADSSDEDAGDDEDDDDAAGEAAGAGTGAEGEAGGGSKKKKKKGGGAGGGGGVDPAFPFAEARRRLVQVRTLPVKGRALVAAAALPAGTVFFREKPYAAIVR